MTTNEEIRKMWNDYPNKLPQTTAIVHTYRAGEKATLARIHKILDDEEARLKERLEIEDDQDKRFYIGGSLATIRRLRERLNAPTEGAGP